MASRPARRWVLSVVILSLASLAHTFPTFVGSNGSVTVETVFGGNLILKPDAGGALLSPAPAQRLSPTEPYTVCRHQVT